MRILFLTMFAVVAAFSLDVQADTILWDESIDGSSADRPLLQLESGSNVILGSSRWIGDEVDPFQFTERDWYDLVLADSYTIVSTVSEILNPVWDTTDPWYIYNAQADWTMQNPTHQTIWLEYTLLGASGPFFSLSELPSTRSGVYLLNQSSALNGIGSWDISWDYRVVIEVRPVAADTDEDGVTDDADNCTLTANAAQRDTDGDSIGNFCDPDVALPNDCAVNFLDLDVYRNNFFQPGDLDTDNNGDGQTNFLDLDFVRDFFFGPPGPSAAGCN